MAAPLRFSSIRPGCWTFLSVSPHNQFEFTLFRTAACCNFSKSTYNYKYKYKLLCGKSESPHQGHVPLQQQLRHASRGVRDPENIGKGITGTNFDTMGTWNNMISMPLQMNESIRRGRIIPKISMDQIGLSSVLGRREYQEDRSIVKKLPYPGGGHDLLYFAVFDGHGGSHAADFAYTTLEDHVLFWLERGERDLGVVLRRAFVGVNNSFARRVCLGSLDKFASGTTATVCLLLNSTELVVAHVGDSRAALNRNGKVVRLTTDHAPDSGAEGRRVLACGGRVSTNSLGVPLVNGRLAMTRSIGDLEFKRYGVTAEPQVTHIEVKHYKDSFLFLTTDGVNFALSDQEVCDIISRCPSPQHAATFITDQALQFGSEDNSTVIVLPFGSWGKYRLLQSDNVQFSFGRLISKSTRW
ncbi:PREDICTED: protein phosphatase 1K, mitochondrial-like [Priapulus caudatus]|uniref:Protein phosphatase 1K, mitochondrial-like n=1 Tax=Priapulus caudatus TaxID=37621 RepID=A0ABM1DQM5_PRICU|nr:PREDICTED: protein phosphatase 1K, mitochondrial-like [Priapulus caudatus]